MEKLTIMESLPVASELISRLGFVEVHPAVSAQCLRNGEPLALHIRLFKNRNSKKVIYFTTATYLPDNTQRYTTLFMFEADNNHEALHKFCLHQLFFDEDIEKKFETEHKLTMQHPNEKAAEWLSWIRHYWNINHFKTLYKELGGLYNYHQIIKP